MTKNWISIPVKHIQSINTQIPKIRQLPVTMRTMQLATFQQSNNSEGSESRLTRSGQDSSNSEAVFLSESTCILENNNKSSSGSNISSESGKRGFLKTAHFKVLAQFQSDQENLIRQHYRHHYSKVHDEN